MFAYPCRNYDRARGGFIFNERSELSQVLMTMAVSGLSELYSSTRWGGTAPISHRARIASEILRNLAAGVVATLVAYGLGVWSTQAIGGLD